MTREKPEPFVDPPILAALGRLVVEFNSLEAALSLATWTLLGCEEQLGECVTVQLPFRGLLNAFCSLCYLQEKDPSVIASIQSLRVRLEAVEQKRNDLLHSMWTIVLEPDLSARFKSSAKAKRGLRRQSADMSAADVIPVADEMAELSGEVLNFWVAYCEKQGIEYVKLQPIEGPEFDLEFPRE